MTPGRIWHMRVAVLLGAGASLDAGLKTTYGLAQDLMTRINSRDVRTWDAVQPELLLHGHMHVPGGGMTDDGRRGGEAWAATHNRAVSASSTWKH